MKNLFVVPVLAMAFFLASVMVCSGGERFSASADGVITDSKTGLQWLAGPDQNTNYTQAEDWIASQTAAGGGWRMPTREELKNLYQETFTYHISPVFKATGYRWVWAEPRDSSSAWLFSFGSGDEGWTPRDHSGNPRVFAVRPQR